MNRRGRLAALLTAVVLLASGCGSGDLPAVAATCDDVNALALLAQAVPEARLIPCFESLPFGYRTTTFDVESGRAEVSLSHAVTGLDAATITISPRCLAGPDEAVAATPPAGERTSTVAAGSDGAVTGAWTVGLDGGCMVVTLQLPPPHGERARDDLDGAWVLRTREEVSSLLQEETGGRLALEDHGSDDDR